MASPRLPSSIVVAVALLALFSRLDAASAFNCSKTDTSPEAVFDCMNAVRTDPQYWTQFARCNLTDLEPVEPVVEDEKLTNAAMDHAAGMAAVRRISHDDFVDRVRVQAGFEGNRITENVAAGQSSALMVVMQWMCSPGHMRNIMDCRVNRVGTGVTCGDSVSETRCYYAQIFGCDARSCPCGGDEPMPPPYPEEPSFPAPRRPEPEAPPCAAKETAATASAPDQAPRSQETFGEPKEGPREVQSAQLNATEPKDEFVVQAGPDFNITVSGTVPDWVVEFFRSFTEGEFAGGKMNTTVGGRK
eukprot:evm.model.scf_717.5 EVM.evm.TU.scf_717.5   scf_717:36236-40900(+)